MAAKRVSKSDKSGNAVAAARGRKSGGSVDAKKLWEGFKSVAGVIAVFLILRTFLLEAYRIPSGSMIPTMLVGDWLFVNKLRYGPHIPFTKINLPGYAEPQRGDIVVFVSPYQIENPQDPTPTVVKRLIAAGGDTIFSRAGVIHINGVPQQQGYGIARPDAGPQETRAIFSWQKEHQLVASRFGPPPVAPTIDDFGPLLVPERHFFMMGDNRYDSYDSRFYGMVPRENVRGRPLFVYYSWNADDSDRIWPAITDIRWSRLGTIIR